MSPCGLLAEDGRRPRSERTQTNPARHLSQTAIDVLDDVWGVSGELRVGVRTLSGANGAYDGQDGIEFPAEGHPATPGFAGGMWRYESAIA